MSSKQTPPAPRRPLSPDDLADLEEEFDACDADGDQRITFAEFSQLLDNLGSEVHHSQRRSRFDAIDLDHDGAIDRAEFIEWWRGP